MEWFSQQYTDLVDKLRNISYNERNNTDSRPCTSAPHRGEDAFGVVGSQSIVFSLMAKEECKEIAKK
jgi:hypothetical protein